MEKYKRTYILAGLLALSIFSALLTVFPLNNFGFNHQMLSMIDKYLVASVGASTYNPTTPTLVVSDTATTTKFGFSLAYMSYTLSDDDLNAELNDLVSLGVGWIRFDIGWNLIQTSTSTQYSWDATDRIITAANAHNLKVLPILAYTPAWARVPGCINNDKCMPRNADEFANFARLAAVRYAPQGVHTWEIWNEPNIPQFWLPAPSSTQYVALLKPTYTAIKSVDPIATIITGGLSPAVTNGISIAPADFLSGLYLAGASGYFDAVSAHPYCFPVTPSTFETWSAWSQMSQTGTSLHSIMQANGDGGKAIWLTEYGAPTGGPGLAATVGNFQIGHNPDHVDEALQSASLIDAISSVSAYPWAGPLFFYTHRDLGTTQDTIENFFGILRNDGTKKPAYDAIKNLLVAPISLPPTQIVVATSSTPVATSTMVASSTSVVTAPAPTPPTPVVTGSTASAPVSPVVASPVVVPVATTPAPSPIPVVVPATPPEYFNLITVGSNVTITISRLNVRKSAWGRVIGTQPLGATGVVVSGPVISSGVTWWNVDFASGKDGWISQKYIK